MYAVDSCCLPLAYLCSTTEVLSCLAEPDLMLLLLGKNILMALRARIVC